MRKRSSYRPRRALAPTLVALHLNPEVCITEQMAIVALRNSWGSTDHFNVLADCRDMLILAACEKRDEQIKAICDIAGIALMNMKDRYGEKARMGATGEELKALEALVNAAEDFWKRQSGGLFVDAEAALSKARAMNRGEGRAAAC